MTPEEKKAAEAEKAAAKKAADAQKAEAKKNAEAERKAKAEAERLAKEKASPTYGMDKISNFKGKFVKASPITSVSEKWLTLHDGKTATYGFIQRYDSDVDAPHLKAKKGDLVFVDKDGNHIQNVTHYLP